DFLGREENRPRVPGLASPLGHKVTAGRAGRGCCLRGDSGPTRQRGLSSAPGSAPARTGTKPRSASDAAEAGANRATGRLRRPTPVTGAGIGRSRTDAERKKLGPASRETAPPAERIDWLGAQSAPFAKDLPAPTGQPPGW